MINIHKNSSSKSIRPKSQVSNEMADIHYLSQLKLTIQYLMDKKYYLLFLLSFH